MECHKHRGIFSAIATLLGCNLLLVHVTLQPSAFDRTRNLTYFSVADLPATESPRVTKKMLH